MVALILGGVYGTYAATRRSLAYSKPRHALQQQARIFLQRFTSEIRCCYAGYENESLQTSVKNTRSIRKEGIEQEEVSLFEGRKVSSGRSFLRFVTSAVTSRREHALGGLAIVEYMLDDSTSTLSRSKRKYINGFEADRDDYDWRIILENVQDITVEYFDGKKWLKEWKSNDMKKSLPKAVRVSLVMQSEEAGPFSFFSVSQIECRKHQIATVSKTTIESDGILTNIDNDQKSDD
jgi:hypothetical protein